ncbi:hypothetical protein JEQ12_007433 [Ovis aries]|uniref:Phosphatidylinositol transfer protein beta isoform n=1 Tax=Ovis aries TaxID=9940 RepID=A0A836CTV5_SHEEP|nr:hypothetical protein JEQ12_007433 [Ovis aries]
MWSVVWKGSQVHQTGEVVLLKSYGISYRQGLRVVLPCSVQEYQVGQLYSVAEASKNETGGGEGIEVLKNEPYEKDGEKGQYTHKIYHLKSKVPAFVRMIAPEGSLVFHEKAWNAYPYCRTSHCLLLLCFLQNEYMKDDFFIKIETWHKPDLGTLENVHGLDPNTWKTVEIVHIDIADRSQVEPADYKADEDPALFQSVKTKRGPLGPNWKKELANNPDCPQMCAYKLVTIKFKWWGLQSKVENFIQKAISSVFYFRGDACILMHCPPPVGSAVRLLPQLALGPPGGAPVRSRAESSVGDRRVNRKIQGSVNLGATSKQTAVESRRFAPVLKCSRYQATFRAPSPPRKPTRGCTNRPGHGPPNTAPGGPEAPQDVRGPRRAERELRERS